MSNILITGASGFIGQHLVRKMLNAGHNVSGLFLDTETTLYFFKKEQITCFYCNIQDKNSLRNIMNGIDIVYHLAAIPRNEEKRTWNEYKSTNIDGTLNLLEEAAHAKSVKRFVLISSVEAAGFGNGRVPRQETDLPHPTNNYGKSKLEAEKIVLNGSWPFECVVLRLPMIYGPGTFIIVPKLFGPVKKGLYPLVGDGESKMEFCYIENAVHAIALAGEKKEAAGELFYISDCRSYTIKEVTNSIAKAMNVNIKYIKVPVKIAYFAAILFEIFAKVFPFPPIVSKFSHRPFFSRETVYWTSHNINIVSIEKARRLLGYQPLISIQDGCKETAEWLDAHT